MHYMVFFPLLPSRHGTLLATGTVEGMCVVWDMETYGVAATFVGHAAPITSVRFFRCSASLLLAAELLAVELLAPFTLFSFFTVGRRMAIFWCRLPKMALLTDGLSQSCASLSSFSLSI